MALGANTEELASQQVQGNSASFDVDAGVSVTVMVTPPLGAGETATIEVDMDLNGDFQPYLSGGAVQLNSAKNSTNLIGPARYRVRKSSTGSACAIRVQR